jgi:hypothetical protein
MAETTKLSVGINFDKLSEHYPAIINVYTDKSINTTTLSNTNDFNENNVEKLLATLKEVCPEKIKDICEIFSIDDSCLNKIEIYSSNSSLFVHYFKK